MSDHPFHPAAEAFPLMGDADLKALADDIGANGQRVPILLWRGQVIDGRNRQLACKLAGVEPEYADWSDVLEAELPRVVESLNEHRRHLSQDWLARRRAERVGRVAEKRRGGKSLRTIADEENVSKSQVERDLANASTVPGGTVAPESGKVTGKDGKERPAGKPRPPSQARKPEACEGESEPTPLDAVGMPIPEGMRRAFAAADRIDEIVKLVRQAQKAVGQLAAEPGGEALRRRCELKESGGRQSFRLDRLHTAAHDLLSCKPHASACPHCHARHPGRVDRDCGCCLGAGWTTKDAWQAAPEDYRAAAELARVGGEP